MWEVMTSDTSIGTKYSRPYLAEGLKDENGNSIYETMVNAARAETKDINRRYELFAEAEQYLIDHATGDPAVCIRRRLPGYLPGSILRRLYPVWTQHG